MWINRSNLDLRKALKPIKKPKTNQMKKQIKKNGYTINIRKSGKTEFVAEICYNDGIVMIELVYDNYDQLINAINKSI